MSGTDSESIRVAQISEGACESGQAGAPVELPVVEVLTGRGLITGKSGSGKSNTASVVSEKLLDGGFGLLIVDIDGEYYGLKEEYEILHAGADEECDIQVTVEHAEKLASLALEGNVPIILDVSSFLDGSEARELLTAVSKHLFAKAKKRKQPFLMLVEEVHEYIPENGSVGECGKMLIKIGKRGRKHGLGIVGISQRPADVKKDFITQCDWLVWHRLTWKNDTKVVRRIIDKEHSEAVEGLDDGEAFLMTDWAGSVRRVQFQRKRTFDAGATPGLDDFERPELKSVSDDLVAELQEISEEKREREDRIAQLREELDRKNSRIAELEAELSDARDMRRMAEQFTDALVEHVERANPGRTEQERTCRRRARANGDGAAGTGERHAEEADSDRGGNGTTDPGTADPVPGDREDDGNDGPDPETTPRSDWEVDQLTRGFEAVEENPLGDRATDAFERGGTPERLAAGDAGEVSRLLREEIAGLDARTRRMLRYYRDHGPGTPMDALFSAGDGDGTTGAATGGSEDRTEAYARNRRLRVRGLIEHVGRGNYAYRVPDLVREYADHRQVGPYVDRIENVLPPDREDDRPRDADGGTDAASDADGVHSGAD